MYNTSQRITYVYTVHYAVYFQLQSAHGTLAQGWAS